MMPDWKEIAKALASGYEVLREFRPLAHTEQQDSEECDENCERCAFDTAMARIDGALGMLCESQEIQEDSISRLLRAWWSKYQDNGSSAPFTVKVLEQLEAYLARPLLDNQLHAHGMGQESTRDMFVAWLIAEGADDLVSKIEENGGWPPTTRKKGKTTT